MRARTAAESSPTPWGAAGTLGGWASLAQAQKPITVGVIYVGPRDDYGYNQADRKSVV